MPQNSFGASLDAYRTFSGQLADLLTAVDGIDHAPFFALLREAMATAATANLTQEWMIEYRSNFSGGAWIRDNRRFPTQELALAAVQADQRDAELSASEDIRYRIVALASFEAAGKPVPVPHRKPTTH